MSKELLLKESHDFISSWTPQSDVRAFRYGGPLVMSSVLMSSAYVNYRFRLALKMKNFAFGSTYFAAVMIPTVAASILHMQYSVSPLLLGETTCSVCREVRSAAIQAGCGVLYPLLLSPLACLQFAERYMTVALPSIQKHPLLLLAKVASIVKPFSKNLVMLAAFQMVVGSCLSQWEYSNLLTVMQKVSAMEEVVAAHVSPEKLRHMKRSHDIADFSDELISAPPTIAKYSGLIEE